MAEFGPVLRRLRTQRALSQEELAARSGLAVTAVSALERGVRRRPQPHTVRALAQALDLDESERAELVGAVPGPDGAVPVSRLLGRDDDLARVCGLLRSGAHPLVTLTGPGGVGKTSLAREVVDRMRREFPQGAVVVDLSSVRDRALVGGALAAAFDLPERRGADRLEALVEYLGPRRLLLVLDNLEQLLPDVPVVGDLMARCPGVVVLATSRAPLRLRSEFEVVVEPLAVPDPWDAGDPDAVAASPAVRMLLARSEAMGARIGVTAANAQTLAAICWRVDGLPLALELAAARTRLLEPADLLARLDDALSTGAVRDLPERQQTIGATLDWSHDLLSPPQQDCFARLAVFPAGFDLAAAEAVHGGDTLGLLGALVDQSLVTRLPPDPDGASRYRLLEPVRQYAAARLARSDAAQGTADRHADLFLHRAAAARPRLRGPDLASALDRLELEHADLRTAFDHLVEHGRPTAAAALAWDVWLFVALRGGVREWLARLGTLRPDDLDEAGRCRLHAARGVLSYVAGDIDPARSELRSAATSVHDPVLAEEVGALSDLVAVFVGDTPRIPTPAPCAASAEVAWSRTLRAAAAGQSALLRGDLAEAAERLAGAEQAARDTGNGFTLALTLNMRATVAERHDDLLATAAMVAESVSTSVAGGLGWPLLYSLPALAAVAARVEQWETAAALFGAAASLTGPGPAGRAGRIPASRDRAPGDVRAVRAALGEDRFASAFARGRLLDRAELDGLAEELRTLARG